MRFINVLSNLLLCVSLLLAPFSFTAPAYAATTLTDINVQLTTIKTSSDANHTITAVTPSTYAEGEVLTIEYDGGFDLSALTEDDFDISDDSTDLTTAADCTGSEQASIGVSGQTITVTICAGDGGGITAGSTIEVQIGTNATASGTGSNQIGNPSNEGTYSVVWATTTSGTSGDLYIPITSDDDGNVSATTPAPQSSGGGVSVISPPAEDSDPTTVTILSPNGGEVFEPGEEVVIEWTSSEDFGFINIRYSVNGGTNYLPIIENDVNDGEYVWSVPDVTSDNALIKIEGTDLATIQAEDISDAFFDIQPPVEPFITVLTPNGGEELQVGQPYEITWNSAGTYAGVQIELSQNFGIGYDALTRFTIDDGSYTFVPETGQETSGGSIRIIGLSATDEEGEYLEQEADASDSTFTILPEVDPYLNLISPNGGELYRVGESIPITWEAETGLLSTTIRVVYTNGQSSIITSFVDSNADSTREYIWNPPQDLIDNQLKIEIENIYRTNFTRIRDASDATFSIVDEEASIVQLQAPNGGEQYRIGDVATITWSALGSIDSYDLYISYNGGEDYVPIALNVSVSEYSWSVQGPVTEQALVRVDGIFEGEINSTDTSNVVFSIREELLIEEEEIEENSEEEANQEEETEQVIDESGDINLTTSVLAAGGTIPLSEMISGYSVLPGTTITVVARTNNPADEIRFIIGGRSIPGERVDINAYSVPIFVGSSSQEVGIVLSANNEEIAKSITLNPVSYGFVGSSEGSAVENAAIFVFQNGSQWPAGIYAQRNPQITTASGAIGWYVPNGVYRVTAAADRYVDAEVSLRVSNNILAPSMTLAAESNLPATPAMIENIPGPTGDVIRSAVEGIVNAVSILNNVRLSPVAQATAEVSKPVIIGTAAVSAAVLASSFNLLPLLQYLFTFPALFFARRRREHFGLVYNAITKVPIPLAVIRVRSKEGALVKSLVTDEAGRYFLRIDPGVYTLEVQKEGLIFPSKYLSGKEVDGERLDIYTNGVIEVTEDDIAITANIPLDPVSEGKLHAPKAIRFKRFVRTFQLIIAPFGLIIALMVFIIQPAALTLAGFVLQLAMFGLTKILVKPKAKKGWGVVRSAETKTGIPNAIVRLFEPKFNKLLETQLTDRKGRYAFLAGANEYYVTAEKSGFQKQEIRPLDYSMKQEPSPISIDVTLPKDV